MAFAVVDLVPQEVLEAWLIIGRLTVLLWHTEIEDISTYTVRLIMSKKPYATYFWHIERA